MAQADFEDAPLSLMERKKQKERIEAQRNRRAIER